VRRRLLDLCLLAYPRARRERDRDYLRDLALELSEAYGLPRQALSLLRGGFRERIEVRPRRPRFGLRTWINRVVVACVMLAALTFAGRALVGTAGQDERVEVERLTCVYTEHPPSKGDRDAGPARCAETKGLVTARVREGWDCATRRRTLDGRRAIAWRCALGQELVAWRAQ
jgi:hypothetical protein